MGDGTQLNVNQLCDYIDDGCKYVNLPNPSSSDIEGKIVYIIARGNDVFVSTSYGPIHADGSTHSQYKLPKDTGMTVIASNGSWWKVG